MWPLRPNAPGCFPTRVGIFLPPYLAALTALGKALLVTWLPTSCAAAGGLVEPHQSHIGSGALPDPWSFGSWTSSSTGSWLWSASERTPGRALLF